MSVPQHQPHCNPPSTKYVPPSESGTTGPRVGFGNKAMESERTPASAGTDLASAMFRVNVRAASAFSFFAMATPFQDTQPEEVAAEIPVGPDLDGSSPGVSSEFRRAPGPSCFASFIPSMSALHIILTLLCAVSVVFT
eukprot:359451-Rhodomonas_salina.1